MKVLYVKQTDAKDCGVSCLISIVRFYGGYVRREYLRELTNTGINGVSCYSLIEVAPVLGMEAKAVKGNINNLKLHLPCIAHIITKNNMGHFVVISKIDSKYITVMDPSCGFCKYNYQEWEKTTTNVYLLYKPKTTILKQEKETSFFKLIIPILKKYKKTFLIIIFFSFVYSVSNIVLSYGFEFFMKSDYSKIKVIFIFLSIILLLKEITNLFRNYLINYMNHIIDKTLIQEIYNHIIRLPYLYFKNHMKGDIITRIEDSFKIRDVISSCFTTFIIDFIFIIIILIAMMRINFKLSIYILGITILLIIVIFLYNFIIRKNLKKMKEQQILLNNHIIESLSSADTIKSMQIEDFLKEKLEYKYSLLQEKSYLVNKNFIKSNFFKEITYGFGLLVVLYLGVLDKFTFSNLVVFYTLTVYYFNPIINICDLNLQIEDAKISFLRIKELLNVDEEKLLPDKKTLSSKLRGEIDIKELKFSYNGLDFPLICKKLHIKGGEKVLLYGVSGSGKSTLMKLIVRYIESQKGYILLDNRALSDYNLLDIRNKITYLSQDETLYTDTVYNNIVLKNNISYEKYLEIIKLTGVSKIIDRSILKSDMMLDNNASNLSGGEKQRILLARTLAKNSNIYIFDESFSAIDIKEERILLKEIFSYLKNKTVIVISHRFNNRDLYQQFILVEKGVVYEY